MRGVRAVGVICTVTFYHPPSVNVPLTHPQAEFNTLLEFTAKRYTNLWTPWIFSQKFVTPSPQLTILDRLLSGGHTRNDQDEMNDTKYDRNKKKQTAPNRIVRNEEQRGFAPVIMD